MTAQTRPTNISRFEDGDTPTGSQFADLVDSFVSLSDTTAQSVSSDLRAANLTTPGKVSAGTIIGSTVTAATGTFYTNNSTNLFSVNINGSEVSGASVRGANLFSTASAQFVTGKFTGAVNFSGPVTASGIVSFGSAVSFENVTNFRAMVTAEDLLYANSSGALCLASGGGTANVVLTTAGNPIKLTQLTTAGGATLVRGFVKIHVEGTVALLPYFYSTT